MNIIKKIILTILILFISNQTFAQVIAPTGVSTRATSQLVFYYDVTEDPPGTGTQSSVIQVTNTNDTEGVWIHVQIFRNLNPDDSNATADNILCDERDFVDFLTPNDTHVYDLPEVNFRSNIGETGADAGQATTLDVTDTKGFIIITPVVSEVDFSAISFQHLFGTTKDDNELNFKMTAMGRDAVDFTTGQIVSDGTVLDGVSNGFVVIQPEELLFNFQNDRDGGIEEADVVGFAFQDNYGPAGLLGYNIIPGDTTWTSFIFDWKESPTSCGNRTVDCFISVGVHDTLEQNNVELSEDDELCSSVEIPNYPSTVLEQFGWVRIFVSGIDDFENHVALFANDEYDGADWMFVRGERTEPNPGENCAVAGDEDGDGNADCADPDCDGLMGPNGEICEAVEATCDDGADNDGDGATDGADTDCDGSESCPTCESGDQCSDGEDNDGDGNSDCADGGCDGATGPNGETCEAGVELTCNDNQDNDGDGTADCDDPDCAIATNCIAGEGGGGGGCSVAATANPSILNFLLPLIVVGLVIGIRRKR